MAERLIGVPGTESIRLHRKPKLIPGSQFSRATDYPADTVLVKTLSLDLTLGDPASRRRVETQALHYDGREWHGYTYEWNDEQTDAVLVAAIRQEPHVFDCRSARARRAAGPNVALLVARRVPALPQSLVRVHAGVQCRAAQPASRFRRRERQPDSHPPAHWHPERRDRAAGPRRAFRSRAAPFARGASPAHAHLRRGSRSRPPGQVVSARQLRPLPPV